jgi:Conserved hypothetical ATP binding protein
MHAVYWTLNLRANTVACVAIITTCFTHTSSDAASSQQQQPQRRRQLPRLAKLTSAIASIVDEYSMVAFVPLDITDEDSVGLVMQHADHVTQYQEGVEPR